MERCGPRARGSRGVNSFKRRSWQKRWAIGPAILLLLAESLFISGFAADQPGEQSNEKVLAGPSQDYEQDGRRMVMSRCAVCHSTDLIVQQRLTREQWTATVSKMVHWGAQLSVSDQAMVVDYLVGRHRPGSANAPEPVVAGGPSQAPALSAIVSPNFQAHPPGRVQQGHVVYRQNCLPCHGETAAGGVGPRLAKNPILVDEQRFWGTVWQGRGTMPGWGAMLTTQEIADVQAWLKSIE